jgi:Lon protease-like protein
MFTMQVESKGLRHYRTEALNRLPKAGRGLEPSDDLDRELPNWMPLLPLANVVALPGVALHLHIFEPRYRQMLEDMNSASPFMALALVEKGHDPEHEPFPPIEPIVCAGRVTHVQPIENGRLLVIFASMARARVLAEDQDSHSYRFSEVAWIHPGAAHEPSDLGLRLGIYHAFETYAESSDLLRGRFQSIREMNLPLGRLVDMLSSCLPLDLELQRRLLAELGPAKRALLLLTILQSVNGTKDPTLVH